MSNSNEEKILIARETWDKYQAEYNHLIKVERPLVQAALKEARAQGDLSENAEYDAARDRQGIVEGRILELESILEKAIIISESGESFSQAQAGIGATVKYINLATNQEKTIQIMGVHDSNPLLGKVSNESPIAKAMEGAKVGDVVEVDSASKYSIRIISVEY
ncbi:transcription elongation factor GreA [Mycoplasmopsis opalescens]|uniref:transcription elongation factor GreA n=1 Tax=Mycoplasmopsis opalescens TaxID=114886 RepID=UPI0004A7261E|nr:transcription elongation factor GreA [Mycoplasmopsis opalescens]